MPKDQFKVDKGQITFDLEGLEKPGSQFHSRKAHHPSANSGVTIGRGYDLKEQTAAQVRKDFNDAGIPKNFTEQYVKCIGKSGKEADDLVK